MGTLVSIISFISMTYGLILIFDISIIDMSVSLEKFVNKERSDLKYKLATRNKSKNNIRNIIKEAYSILDLMNEKDKLSYIWVASLLLFILGVIISVAVNNLLLTPILSIGFALIPFWYLFFQYISFRRRINDELETSLSIITTSYIRSDNIAGAIKENIDYIDEPLKSTFQYFLNQSRLITSNTKLAIKNMKDRINNDVFKEWCDILIACQDNRNLKHTLIPVVNKLSDTRIISAQLDNLLYQPIKEFIMMMIMVLANIPIIRLLNKEWYIILTTSTAGKIVLTFTIASVFISLNAIVRLSRPIEYKS